MSGMLPAVEERQIKQQPQVGVIANLENLIKNTVKAIGDLNSELKQNREMYVDSFINDPVYNAKEKEVLKQTNELKKLRASIAKQEGVAALEQKVKDLRFDKREKQKNLSALVLEYKEQSGATQLELFDHEVVDIVTTAKLRRHPKPFKKGKK